MAVFLLRRKDRARAWVPFGWGKTMDDSVEGPPAVARRGVAVPSLRKAVAILDLIGRRGSQTFSAIQRSLDLPKSTTH